LKTLLCIDNVTLWGETPLQKLIFHRNRNYSYAPVIAYHPMRQPDSAKPARSDLDAGDSAPRDAPAGDEIPAKALGTGNSAAPRRESDIAELAAKFAAHGGGKIPAELSGELALDIVLNEIVEQACLATGATGAAIALARGEEMVCRASSGGNAPELGTRLDVNSGLSGVCMRTRQIQCCDDALSDPSADAAASRQLGVRSVMVLPLLRNQELIGIFEVFSSRPCAFGDRDLRTLEVLSERILKNTEARESSLVSVAPVPPDFAPNAPVENAVKEIEPEKAVSGRTASDVPVYDSPGVRREPPAGDGIAVRPRLDWLTATMAAIVCSVAILMVAVFAVRVGWLNGPGRQPSHAAPAPSSSSSASSAVLPVVPAAQSGKSENAGSLARETGSTASAAEKKLTPARPESQMENARIPEGSLRVYESGKEVFRMPAAAVDTSAASSTENVASPASAPAPAKIVELAPDAASGSLLRRVEPEYPEQALARRVQGPVLLDVRISREGKVQDVKLVSGDPLLANAAVAAVRQWRFKPHTVNGRAVEMETKITLNFALPPS
jgi:TonB family protein